MIRTTIEGRADRKRRGGRKKTLKLDGVKEGRDNHTAKQMPFGS